MGLLEAEDSSHVHGLGLRTSKRSDWSFEKNGSSSRAYIFLEYI